MPLLPSLSRPHRQPLRTDNLQAALLRGAAPAGLVHQENSIGIAGKEESNGFLFSRPRFAVTPESGCPDHRPPDSGLLDHNDLECVGLGCGTAAAGGEVSRREVNCLGIVIQGHCLGA